jgi:hypothetical protein
MALARCILSPLRVEPAPADWRGWSEGLGPLANRLGHGGHLRSRRVAISSQLSGRFWGGLSLSLTTQYGEETVRERVGRPLTLHPDRMTLVSISCALWPKGSSEEVIHASAFQRVSSGSAGWETVPFALSCSPVRSDKKHAPREGR